MIREIKEHKGYTDIEGQFYTFKEDALLSSIEVIMESCIGERLQITKAPLMKHKEELLYLLGEYYKEVEGGN